MRGSFGVERGRRVVWGHACAVKAEAALSLARDPHKHGMRLRILPVGDRIAGKLETQSQQEGTTDFAIEVVPATVVVWSVPCWAGKYDLLAVTKRVSCRKQTEFSDAGSAA
jgi:hypothetical protein